MIAYNQEKMYDEMAQSMMYQGLSMDQYLKLVKTTKEQMLERMKPDAIARIKSGLVLDAIVDAENITPTDEEIEEELQNMASAYQMELEKIKELLGEREMKSVKKDLAAKKALDFIASNCKEV